MINDDNAFIIEKLTRIIEEANNGGSNLVSIYSSAASTDEAHFTSSDYAYISDEIHDFYEIAIILKGTAVFMMDGRYYPLHENQICILDKGIIHANGWKKTEAESALILWLNVMGSKLRIHSTSYSKNRSYSSGMDIIGLDESLIYEIVRELKSKRSGYEDVISLYTKSFLTMICRRLESNTIYSGNVWNKLIVKEAEEYIAENITSRITLQEMSRHLAVSQNYLSMLFRQIKEQSLLDYVHEMKINKSKPLLHTTMTLSEIAQHFGFYDQFHFSKVFKKYTKISPSQFRKQANVEQSGK